MKNILSVLFLLLFLTSAQAQQNTGTLIPAKIFQRSLMVGGSVSGGYKKLDNSMGTEPVSGRKIDAMVNAKIGYFILNDVALGGQASLSHIRQKLGDSDERTTYLLLGPFARYYLNSGVFGEASYALGVNNSYSGSKADVAEARVGVGYAWFINPKVAIEPALHFTHFKEKRVDNNTQDRYQAEYGPSFSVGLQVYLFRERKMALR